VTGSGQGQGGRAPASEGGATPQDRNIACRTAPVGRLDPSTLHRNSVEAAPARLVDLGVPDFVVRSVLRGVLGQGLRVEGCPGCGGAGCAACGGSGALGRRLEVGLWEG